MIKLHNSFKWFTRREPTAAERLQAIVTATANSPKIRNYRCNRAAGRLGHQRKRSMT